MEVVESGDTVAPKFQHVPETFRSDEGGLGTFLFNDGVSGYRETMAHFGNHLGSDSQFFDAVLDAVQDCSAVVVGGASHFASKHLAVVTQEDDVGERATDINANAEFLHSLALKLEDIRNDTLVGI